MPIHRADSENVPGTLLCPRCAARRPGHRSPQRRGRPACGRPRGRDPSVGPPAADAVRSACPPAARCTRPITLPIPVRQPSVSSCCIPLCDAGYDTRSASQGLRWRSRPCGAPTGVAASLALTSAGCAGESVRVGLTERGFPPTAARIQADCAGPQANSRG